MNNAQKPFIVMTLIREMKKYQMFCMSFKKVCFVQFLIVFV